jgi:hypothetical protein
MSYMTYQAPPFSPLPSQINDNLKCLGNQFNKIFFKDCESKQFLFADKDALEFNILLLLINPSAPFASYYYFIVFCSLTLI